MNTIISKKTKNKTVLLNKLQTEEFLQRIDKALHSFEHIEIFKVILDFKLTSAKDIDDFLSQSRAVTKVSDKYETIVINVSPFQTKCIACSYGKTVSGYEVRSVVKDCKNIGFISKVAINFDIREGELYDFSWCNGFLSREEVSEINKL